MNAPKVKRSWIHGFRPRWSHFPQGLFVIDETSVQRHLCMFQNLQLIKFCLDKKLLFSK